MFRLILLIALLSFFASVQAWGVSTSGSRLAVRRGGLSMKIFDWKQREAFADYEIPSGKLWKWLMRRT